MVILEEAPSEFIRHTIDNFYILPDKQTVSRINQRLTTLQQIRDMRGRGAESQLKKLSRQLASLTAHHTELKSSHSSAAHASEIARLDTHKFRVAKACSDAEMEAERLSGQLADLQARLQELEMGDDAAGGADVGGGGGVAAAGGGSGGGALVKRRDPVEEEVLLRLKVYRSLGIDLEREGGAKGDGEFTKAIVRNDRKGDVHVVNMDKKFSRFFYANYFWSTM